MAELSNSFHTHQSWGRTRSPKNILSTHRAGTTAAGAPLVLTTSGGAQTFTTENQRFLHVVITVVNSATLKIEGEMFAATTYTGTPLAPATFSPMTLKDVNGTAVAALAAGSYLIEIAGVDKIGFTSVGGTSCTFYAACSTF